MFYYCELNDTDWYPEEQKFDSPDEAIKFYTEKYGNRVEVIYDDNFYVVYVGTK